MTSQDYTTKTCTKCKIENPLTEFNKSKSCKYGVQAICRSCSKMLNNAYRHTRDGCINSIYSNQKFNSSERGHAPPDYTLKELRFFMRGNVDFDRLYLNWVNSGYNKWKAPSCDRRDDYLPYTFDNILRVCTWQENYDRAQSDRKNGINNKANKAVIQMGLDGLFIAKHYSISSAGRETNVNFRNIQSSCAGLRTQAGGFKWKYINES